MKAQKARPVAGELGATVPLPIGNEQRNPKQSNSRDGNESRGGIPVLKEKGAKLPVEPMAALDVAEFVADHKAQFIRAQCFHKG